MDERIELIELLDRSRARMRAVLACADARRQIYPPWTMKQVVAHLSGWDDATFMTLQAHAGGTEPAVPAVRGIDHYNSQTVAEREALNYDQIVREWEAIRTQLKALIAQMPDERLREPFVFPWGPQGTAAELVGIMAHHEGEHAEEIEHLLAEASQPR